ncbi:salicylic acid-binding protein 2-like isoform X2 [Gastrolobium bilobum]|uniref:salicylic acid-binding protein 2-like isoform X2 n=1 Tax=Gastrolobium bilobum TaxID=150636 RepID=UPI002AB0FC3E|nr:salicylic acid-binding protein 2-like isoform X2 [Gastrolobium bilobum]
MGTENSVVRKHYVLVHGACHGAWSWYKVKPRLESAGHQVTVLDLAASGTNMKKIEDVDTFSQYSEPLLQLLATIPPNEKVVLVGHSLGGPNIALAMDIFPQKVAVGVFLAAFVPDLEHKPSYVIEKDLELAKTLIRPGSLFPEDLSQRKNFSKEGYGSVPRAFIVCTDDLGIPLKFQLWMIENAGINDMLEINGADHMAMLSKPQELCDSLQQIALKYA